MRWLLVHVEKRPKAAKYVIAASFSSVLLDYLAAHSSQLLAIVSTDFRLQ